MTDVKCPPQGQELCDWVATKIMGWEKEKGEFGLVLWSDSGLMAEEGWNSCEFPEFRPDKNLNHTDMMEARLKEMGLKRIYTAQLAMEITPRRLQTKAPPKNNRDDFVEYQMEIWQALVYATAEQRVRAAWEVMQSLRKEVTTT